MKLLFHNNLKNATRCESKIRLQKKRGLQHFIEHLQIISNIRVRHLDEQQKEKIAESNAKTILLVYHLREKNNRNGEFHIFPENVWWLTSQIKIERIKNILKDRFREMPNMSPTAVLALLSNIPELEKASNNVADILSSALCLQMSHLINDSTLDYLHIAFHDIKNMKDGKKKIEIGRILEKLRKGDINKIQSSLETVFDKKLDFEKHLNKYSIQKHNNISEIQIWKDIKSDQPQDILYCLKLFSEVRKENIKPCFQWLKENGFKKDVQKIDSLIRGNLLDQT